MLVRSRRRLLFGLLLVSLSCVIAVAGQARPVLTLENLWTLRGLSEPHWSPDGKLIAFTVSEPEKNSTDIFVSDLEGNVRRLTGSTADSTAARQQVGTTVGLPAEPWTPDGRQLLYVSRGSVYLLDVQSQKSRALVELKGKSKGYTPQVYFNGPDPVLSPDGTRLAYVRESEIWVLDLAAASLRQLTASHTGGWHNMQPRWSPDGTRILYTAQSVDEQRPFPFPDFSKSVIDVAFALIGYGHVRVGVVPADGGETRWFGAAAGLKYSLRGGSQALWAPDGQQVAIDRLSLDHTKREIVVGTVQDGSMRTIWTEKVDHWISPLAIWLRWSPDAKSLLFTSEQDGWNHLYVIPARGGEPLQLTRGTFTVTNNQVYDNSESTPIFSADGTKIYFPSNEAGTPERHLYVVPASGGPWTRVTPLAGVDMSSTVSPDGIRVAYLHSDPGNPPELFVQDMKGGAPRRLTSLTVPDTLKGYKWVEPQILTYPNTQDATPVAARLYLPRDLNKARKYPAVIFIHGAGYTQSVFRGWVASDRNAFNQYLVQSGFVVLDVDYRGSAGYGRKFRLDVFDRVGDIDLQDVLSGVEYLKATGYIDPSRIGIWGHSYGGFMVCIALLRAPKVFAAGAAGAPVTDWERFFYLAPGYNEEHFGFPWDNPEGTRRASPLTYADKLERPLLLLSGVQDTMHLDSAALVNKLLELRRPVEWFFYPNEPHGFQQPQAREDYYRRIAAFLERHLQAPAAKAGE
jgi:dipeptidyl aminopeptidase/acylaminoacyl peptidase